MQSWQSACETLQKSLGSANFDAWIKPLRVREAGEGRVLVEAPSKFYRDWLVRNHLKALQDALKDAAHPRPEIEFHIEASRQRELFLPTATEPTTEKPRRRANARLGSLVPHYTLTNFVVGPSNQFAHAASLAVAGRPGEKYNPLFIYGAVGVGKTHLVNAIGHRVLEKTPLAKIVYLSSEAFVNDLIDCLRRDRMHDFKNRFRKVDVLILDDVQFIAGRERTQEEFFHTFNTLHDNRRQIVLTSDKYPKDIPDLEERLRNRFEWGLTADIQTPDTETRAAIVQKKAEIEGLAITAEVADFIAHHVGNNVRELEGALTRLGAVASLHEREISLDFATEVLRSQLRLPPRELTIEEIQKTVCEHYAVSLEEMKSKRRTQHIAPVRQVAMYLCREMTSFSFPAIGDRFGGRHHSTVIHAHETVEQRLKKDPGLSATVQALQLSLSRTRA